MAVGLPTRSFRVSALVSDQRQSQVDYYLSSTVFSSLREQAQRVSVRGPSFDARAHRLAFGLRVGNLRHERGWTQEVLAERADVHRSYLASIEAGRRNPTLDVIVKLANGLHVPVAALFD